MAGVEPIKGITSNQIVTAELNVSLAKDKLANVDLFSKKIVETQVKNAEVELTNLVSQRDNVPKETSVFVQANNNQSNNRSGLNGLNAGTGLNGKDGGSSGGITYDLGGINGKDGESKGIDSRPKGLNGTNEGQGLNGINSK